MSICITRAGIKYVSIYDYCRSQTSQFMTPAGVKCVSMYDDRRSHVSQCMTPAGVMYLNA